MVIPLVLRKGNQFVPFTNQPPFDLAEYLGHDGHIRALLLNNPDISTVLFSAASRESVLTKGTCKLDFTSTHHEPAIVARNVLLLAGLIRSSGMADEELQHLWAIHFHFHLNQSELGLFETICSELVEASLSSSVWHASPFGQAGIYICTDKTLDELRIIWKQYLSMIRTNVTDSSEIKNRFTAAAAVKFRNSYDPARGVLPVQVGVAAGGPLWRQLIESGASRDLYTEYWSNGTISGWKALDRAFVNPSFAVSSSNKTFPLHHAAEPCHGFDLSKPLAASFPGSSPSLAQRCAEYAREQFNSWSRTVSTALQTGSVVVRFFAGDAIAFCHEMQKSEDNTTTVLTAPWSSKTLALNERDYLIAPASAPRRFATIDASHVADIHGLVTTLLCCEALVEHTPILGVLYTRVTLQQHTSQSSSEFLQALGVDASFLGLFVGLAPKPYLDGFVHPIDTPDISSARASTNSSAVCAHLAWIPGYESRDYVPLTCNGQELGSLLYEVMVRLTRYDDVLEFQETLDSSRYQVLCTRMAFVDLLLRVNRSVTQQLWMVTLQKFISLCTNHGDPRNLRRLSSYQDLIVHLFLRGIDVGLLAAQSVRNVYPLRKEESPLKGWTSPTLAVYATIVVPRARVKKLRNVLKKSDLDLTLAGVVNYHPAGSGSHFHSVLATFGSATQIESRTGGRVSIALAGVNDGVAGDEELVVSFCIPGWLLMRGQSDTPIGVQVHMVPSLKFQSIASELGPDLIIFGAPLSENSRQVMFSREPPHINGRQWKMQLPMPPLTSSRPSSRSLEVAFSVATCSIKTVTAHVPIPARAREEWQAKHPVSIQQMSPTQLGIVTKDMRYRFSMPIPVDAGAQRSKVARQSMYLETTLPIVRAASLLGRSAAMSSSLTLPRISLENCWTMDAMPSSDDDWFSAHLAATYTDTESATIKAGNPDAFTPLLKFKQWLQDLFMRSRTELSNGALAIRLPVPGSEHHHLLIVRAILVDLNTRAVILDALHLNPERLTLENLVQYDALLQQTVTLDTSFDAAVSACWTQLFPAYAERIRTTTHTEACSSALAWQNQPLRMGDDATCVYRLCACLRGVDASLVTDEWKSFAPFLTRLAVSPLFASPCFDVTGGNTKPLRQPGAGEGNANVGDSGGGTIGACARCGKTNKKLLKCGRCKGVAYCSKECQTVHWPVHKTECQKAR